MTEIQCEAAAEQKWIEAAQAKLAAACERIEKEWQEQKVKEEEEEQKQKEEEDKVVREKAQKRQLEVCSSTSLIFVEN